MFKEVTKEIVKSANAIIKTYGTGAITHEYNIRLKSHKTEFVATLDITDEDVKEEFFCIISDFLKVDDYDLIISVTKLILDAFWKHLEQHTAITIENVYVSFKQDNEFLSGAVLNAFETHNVIS